MLPRRYLARELGELELDRRGVGSDDRPTGQETADLAPPRAAIVRDADRRGGRLQELVDAGLGDVVERDPPDQRPNAPKAFGEQVRRRQPPLQ